MDNNEINNEQKQRKKLFFQIIREYIYVIIAYICIFLALPWLGDFMIGDNTGIDGIGPAIVVGFILRGIRIIIMSIVSGIIPFLILVLKRKVIKEIKPKIKKICYIVFILLPVIIPIILVLEVPISNFLYTQKYETGKNAYIVNKENYKLPQEFYNKLKERDLLYNNNDIKIKRRLNSKFLDTTENNNIKSYDYSLENYGYYTTATMLKLNKNVFYDYVASYKVNDYLKDSAPVYVYNAILTLPEKDEDLQYAALGRYSYNVSNDVDGPFYKDYYIELKIFYVDGDMYAIIGPKESYNINYYYNYYSDYKNSKDYDKSILYNYNHPYNMILSETGKVKTYYNEKYYPNGGLENSGGEIEMRPNNNQFSVSHYPISKIDKLDRNSINEIAKDLQKNILKDSIEYHFNEIEEDKE